MTTLNAIGAVQHKYLREYNIAHVIAKQLGKAHLDNDALPLVTLYTQAGLTAVLHAAPAYPAHRDVLVRLGTRYIAQVMADPVIDQLADADFRASFHGVYNDTGIGKGRTAQSTERIVAHAQRAVAHAYGYIQQAYGYLHNADLNDPKVRYWRMCSCWLELLTKGLGGLPGLTKCTLDSAGVAAMNDWVSAATAAGSFDPVSKPSEALSKQGKKPRAARQ